MCEIKKIYIMQRIYVKIYSSKCLNEQIVQSRIHLYTFVQCLRSSSSMYKTDWNDSREIERPVTINVQ